MVALPRKSASVAELVLAYAFYVHAASVSLNYVVAFFAGAKPEVCFEELQLVFFALSFMFG